MKRLLHKQNTDHRMEYWWLHTGDNGEEQITVEFVEDVEPIFERVKRQRDMPNKGDLRHVASIPETVIEETARINANAWGIRTSEAFREIMQGKTDRAQSVWKMLCKGRDYRKFQRAG